MLRFQAAFNVTPDMSLIEPSHNFVLAFTKSVRIKMIS